ncbi:Ltp family lipoprotein [Microbacterium immunditiarum]|uniref:PASTA domain-containing protein n=1 Tax=Microbacterium immunditiarum TaxID=337480 RepID=A0A7Y9KIT1_9MICO|nr:Ltp family lipoprotein [Microbacterium immunditiarum]NYE18936.1 hypothetical protein [Microbacterium immunditiarum]
MNSYPAVPPAVPAPDTVPPYAAPAPPSPYQAPAPPGKQFIAAWLLSYFLGVFGVDRFYLGKVGTGLLKLFTFGGFGIWWLIDLILILAGAARDKDGRPLEGYDRHKKVAWIVTGAIVALGIIIGAVNGAIAASLSNDLSPADGTQISREEPPVEEPAPVDDREQVPGLIGLTVAEARAAVEDAGFVLAVPEGASDDWVVLTQTLSEGRQADPGTEIFVTAEAPEPVLTLAQKNAVRDAESYLEYSGFSRAGLIGQLEYEGYSKEDATFAVDFVEADWNAEAAESAQSYLDYSSFSRQGLYDQLAYEGFTPEQIEFALGAVGY